MISQMVSKMVVGRLDSNAWYAAKPGAKPQVFTNAMKHPNNFNYALAVPMDGSTSEMKEMRH